MLRWHGRSISSKYTKHRAIYIISNMTLKVLKVWLKSDRKWRSLSCMDRRKGIRWIIDHSPRQQDLIIVKRFRCLPAFFRCLLYRRSGWVNYRITQLSSLPSRWGRLNKPTASLQRSKTPPNECPRYDSKQSDGEVPAMLELWGMQTTPLLPSLPGLLWPGVVAPHRVLSVGQTEVNRSFESLPFFCI